MSTLTIRDLDVTLGEMAVLRGVDLEVPSGSVTAVLGPSGCGKTTLLRAVAGFVRPEGGEIRIGDAVVVGPGRHLAPERRGVALVPQEGALFPHLSVGQNVAFGLPRSERRRSPRVAEVLELVGLAGYEDRRPDELSGGQQQRVAVARALAPDPSVVLLDEPFSALDASLRESVRSQVRDALDRSRATALVVTHDQDEALSVADSVAVLDEGRILMHATPQDVYRAPTGLGVARFVGQCVELPADVTGGVAATALGALAVDAAVAGPAHGVVMLRPEQLRLLPADAPDGTAGEVVGGEYFGHDALVRVRLSGPGTGPPFDVQVRTLGEIPERGPVRVAVRGAARFYPLG
ncbi:ABC transporter ATP-binding protein [Fodinibacter luteus]|uniref:ABC transporter ATP-binding protein n=1 Tax=Fodinibacter luteus TaxID=552064 RepID=A0ABP8KCD0_9MICO